MSSCSCNHIGSHFTAVQTSELDVHRSKPLTPCPFSIRCLPSLSFIMSLTLVFSSPSLLCRRASESVVGFCLSAQLSPARLSSVSASSRVGRPHSACAPIPSTGTRNAREQPPPHTQRDDDQRAREWTRTRERNDSVHTSSRARTLQQLSEGHRRLLRPTPILSLLRSHAVSCRAVCARASGSASTCGARRSAMSASMRLDCTQVPGSDHMEAVEWKLARGGPLNSHARITHTHARLACSLLSFTGR